MIPVSQMSEGALMNAKAFAESVYQDPLKKERVTWDVDTFFWCLITTVGNTKSAEQGGFIQEYVASIEVPRLWPNGDGTYSEQLPDGIPDEVGDIISIRGAVRRVISVEESFDDSGWTLTLAGPDEGK